MQVRILQDIDYTPRPDDSPKCVGQLHQRQGRKLLATTGADGARVVEEVGPERAWYFRKGATPILADDAAQDFIARGIAEPMPGADKVLFVSTREILDGIQVQ